MMISSLDISIRYDDISAGCWSEWAYVVLSVFSAPFSSTNLSVFLKLVNMAHNEASLMKLNEEDLVRITLDYQGKFNNILDLKKDISDLKSDLCGLMSDFYKLQADIQVTRNVNSKLSEKRCYANERYSRRKCLEISGIPASAANRPYLGWGLSSFTLNGLAKVSHYQIKLS